MSDTITRSTRAWEITSTGARSFTASGDELLEVLTSLVAATQPERLLSDEKLAGGLHISITFGDGEYTGTLTVEV